MAMQLTGSLEISGSINAQSFLQDGQPFSSDPFPYTGSAIISGSLRVTGSINATQGFTGSFTGSLTGTATSASYAVSASHVIGGVNPFPYTGSAVVTGACISIKSNMHRRIQWYIMVSRRSFNCCKMWFSRSRNTKRRTCIWWWSSRIMHRRIQRIFMVCRWCFNNCKTRFSRSRNTKCRTCFWWALSWGCIMHRRI